MTDSHVLILIGGQFCKSTGFQGGDTILAVHIVCASFSVCLTCESLGGFRLGQCSRFVSRTSRVSYLEMVQVGLFVGNSLRKLSQKLHI